MGARVLRDPRDDGLALRRLSRLPALVIDAVHAREDQSPYAGSFWSGDGGSTSPSP